MIEPNELFEELIDMFTCDSLTKYSNERCLYVEQKVSRMLNTLEEMKGLERKFQFNDITQHEYFAKIRSLLSG